ncbi:MAG: Rpn family recombination-promoting nuclease/putative transposase [Victivallales bacterium]|nr:Rpn family recombination-promoting nuclease/putative transposase [Victivallales bacterium]
MGLKDTAAKNFFGRPDVMANLLDYVLYGGQPTVQTSQLRELSGEHYRIVQDENGRLKTDNRFRDKLFEYDTGNGKLTVGFEFQSKNDKNMVIRVMRYDIRRIEQALSSGGHGRIINLVLSFDRKSSCLATSLEEMCGKAPSIAEKYSYNYGFVSLNIYDLVEKLELFSCKELKEVLNYFKNAQDREHLMKAITEGTLKGRLSRDAALVCAVFLGLEIDIDNEAEEIDMCKAFRDFKRECILEGKRLGIDEGIAIGEEKALRSFIKNLLDKSFGLFDICVLTGASEEMVKEEIALAVQH